MILEIYLKFFCFPTKFIVIFKNSIKDEIFFNFKLRLSTLYILNIFIFSCFFVKTLILFCFIFIFFIFLLFFYSCLYDGQYEYHFVIYHLQLLQLGWSFLSFVQNVCVCVILIQLGKRKQEVNHRGKFCLKISIQFNSITFDFLYFCYIC